MLLPLLSVPFCDLLGPRLGLVPGLRLNFLRSSSGLCSDFLWAGLGLYSHFGGAFFEAPLGFPRTSSGCFSLTLRLFLSCFALASALRCTLLRISALCLRTRIGLSAVCRCLFSFQFPGLSLVFLGSFSDHSLFIHCSFLFSLWPCAPLRAETLRPRVKMPAGFSASPPPAARCPERTPEMHRRLSRYRRLTG